MRAFVALDLPEAARAALLALQAGLRVGRIVPEDNLHLTLAFLGDIPDSQAFDLAEALHTATLPAASLALHGLDLFGPKRAAVLAAKGEGAGLEALHAKVMRTAREAGIALPRRRFRPHVTLARLPRDLGARSEATLADFLALNARFDVAPTPAPGLTLYRSHLRQSGALYEPLAEVSLPR